MNETEIAQYIVKTFDSVDVHVASQATGAPEIAWGDTFFFYDPDCTLPPERRFPFATIVTKDYGEFDCASNLNRPGVFRLNIGVGKETYRSLFEPQPSPPDASIGSGVDYDFSALDQLLPHPVYGPQSWICILNPSEQIFETIEPLLAEAYQSAVRKYHRANRGPIEADRS